MSKTASLKTQQTKPQGLVCTALVRRRVGVRFVECWKAMPSELAPLARQHGITIIRCSKPNMVCFTFLAGYAGADAWAALDADLTARGWKWYKRDPLGMASHGMTVKEAKRIPRADWADSANASDQATASTKP